jgi:cellulose synthase/poly-beta-1,6-N-acetylglucosamine synthase-like glycosyltransferase
VATPTWPFEGLPLAWAVLFTICLVVVVAMFLWTLLLFVRGHKAIARPPEPPPEGADAFSWVFLVPALNEEVTIADSVQRLIELPVARRRVIVIDDGSDDRTAEILAAIDHPDLFVLHRRAPDARQGKAAALNFAYRSLAGHADRERTIVVIVDADGRLRASAPHFAASHFAEPKVGGMQALVRIYNRQHPLTWLQDVEFSVYGHLFQAGRDHWGTAGMGGNGQFNRLGALDSVADEEGPWRDKLTEDQDLGLRLIAAGWEGRHDLRATVDQQGLSKLLPLFRQRTRWSQGNLQAMALWRQVLQSPPGRAARVEQLAYMLMPIWQGIVGLGLLGALFLLATGTAPFWGTGPTWQLGFFYLLAFGGTMLGCIAARAEQGPLGWLKGILIAQVYTPYTWFLWPVLVRSTVRQLTSRGNWAKTEREPISEGESPATPKASPAVAAAAAPTAPSVESSAGRAPKPARG